jgi:hypothetical protein
LQFAKSGVGWVKLGDAVMDGCEVRVILGDSVEIAGAFCTGKLTHEATINRLITPIIIFFISKL